MAQIVKSLARVAAPFLGERYVGVYLAPKGIEKPSRRLNDGSRIVSRGGGRLSLIPLSPQACDE